MLTWWQDILIALIGGLLGGGLIDTYLNWRRFQREQEEVKKEERQVAIDRIRSVCSVTLWEASTTKGDKLELYMYRSGLTMTVREYIILLEFAIRNLTDESVIITRVEIEESGLPPLPDYEVIHDDRKHDTAFDAKGNVFPEIKETGFVAYDAEAFYDWKTKAERDRTEVDYATLEPKGTITVAYVAIRRFCALRRLEEPPTEISIAVRTTGDHEVRKTLALEYDQLWKVSGRVDEYPLPAESFAWIEWEHKRKKEEEDEIPF